MRYTIRRVGLGRLARLGCALGWLGALLPAACLSALGVVVVQRTHQALEQVAPITLSLFGQELIRIDLLEVLQLQPAAQGVAQWAEEPLLLFTYSGLVLMLAGAMVLMLTSVLVGAAYNLAARAGWGLSLELEEARPPAVRK